MELVWIVTFAVCVFLCAVLIRMVSRADWAPSPHQTGTGPRILPDKEVQRQAESLAANDSRGERQAVLK